MSKTPEAMKGRILVAALSFAILSSGVLAQSAALDRTEILGRLAHGYSPSYIAHLVKTRGISFSPSDSFLAAVERAGGDGILVERLSSVDMSNSLSWPDEDVPFEHLGKCAEFIHTGDLDSARPECRASIEENPKSPWPLLLMAQVIVPDSVAAIPSESDKKIDAERGELLRRAVSLAPNLSVAHLDFASALRGSQAIKELGTASDLDPEQMDNEESESSFSSSVDLPIPSDESDPPNPELLRLMKIDPDLADVHVGLAYQSTVAHDFDKAQAEMEEAIRLEPDDAQLHILFGSFYFQQHKTDAGLAELREAARIVPFGYHEREALVNALESLGRTQDAVSELKKFLEISPAAVQPSDALVDLYLDAKDRKSAIGELSRSLKASSLVTIDGANLVDARFDDLKQLGDLLSDDGQFDAAAEEFLFLLRYKPDAAGIHNDYGNVLLAQQHIDEALSEYYEALRIEPDMATAHHNIGLCFGIEKDLDGAIREFQQAVELNPDDPSNQESLGYALAQKGDLKGALDQFHRAIERHPKDPEPHLSLAYILEKMTLPVQLTNSSLL